MHVKARSPFLSDLKSDEVSLIGTKEEEEEEEEPWHGFHWLVERRFFSSNHRERAVTTGSTRFLFCRFSVKQCIKVVGPLIQRSESRNGSNIPLDCTFAPRFDHEPSKGGPSPYSHRNSVNHESAPLRGTHYPKYIVTNVMNYQGNNSVNLESTIFRVLYRRNGEICRADIRGYLRWN